MVGEFIDDAGQEPAGHAATSGRPSEAVGARMAGQFIDEAPDDGRPEQAARANLSSSVDAQAAATATELYDRAVAAYEQLVRRHGRSDLASDLARAQANKAVAIRALGQDRAALALSDQAVALYERLVSEGREDLRGDLEKAKALRISGLSSTVRPDPQETQASTVPMTGEPRVDIVSDDPRHEVTRLLQAAQQGEESLRDFVGFELDRELGRGGMGAVFLLRRQATGEQIACKVLLPELTESDRLRSRFLREISVARAVRHANLVPLLRSGAWQKVLWYTMPFYAGGNVLQLVRTRGGRLSPAEACPIALQVLDGLDCLQQAKLPEGETDEDRDGSKPGVVHRDIKPENILLDGVEGAYTALLGDYGLAKFRALASQLTGSGAVAGTWQYMSRQQLADFKRAGPEVDVWAVAACLYFMLTGKTPRDFPKGEQRPWLVIERTEAVPIRQRGLAIPEQVADLLGAALDDTGPLRFQSAAEFRAALLRCMGR
jgi:hypothetical protein